MNGVPPDIQILIVDDRAMVREALRNLLMQQPGVHVSGEAANGKDALRKVSELQPDILLLDLCRCPSSGMATLRVLATDSLPVRTIIFADHADKSHFIEALMLGARGIVEKQTSASLLMKCIRAVAAGEYWVAHRNIPDLIAYLRTSVHGEDEETNGNHHRLTAREIEIVSAISDGCKNKEIAQKYGISEQTVKHHLTSIFAKVGVANRLELALSVMRTVPEARL